MNADDLERNISALRDRFENEYYIKEGGVIEIYGSITPEQEQLIKDHGLTINHITE